MHNNVLALRWEREEKRREQDKEAKVSQGQANAVGSLLAFPNTPRCLLLGACPRWPNKEEESSSGKK